MKYRPIVPDGVAARRHQAANGLRLQRHMVQADLASGDIDDRTPAPQET
jgi:hypothetical protein